MLSRFTGLLGLGLIHPELMAVAWRVKKYKKTYLSYPTLLSLARNFRLAMQRQPGGVQAAEFGVGRGGSATIFAWMAGRYGGSLALFDIFGRIPPPTQADGERARQRYEVILHAESENYYGNQPNLLELIKADLSAVCDVGRIEFIQGSYEQILPLQTGKRSLGVVHIDCDWYESSTVVYAYLKDNLAPGAVIQVDDYSNWEGSRKAFDEVPWLGGKKTRLVDGALVVDTGRSM